MRELAPVGFSGTGRVPQATREPGGAVKGHALPVMPLEFVGSAVAIPAPPSEVPGSYVGGESELLQPALAATASTPRKSKGNPRRNAGARTPECPARREPRLEGLDL